jgi:hypothetical protein
MQYVLPDHLLQRLFLRFFAIKLLDFHNIFTLNILWLVLAVLKLALSFLIVRDEIVNNAFQFLDRPPVLRLCSFGRLVTSCSLILIDFCNKLANKPVKLLRLLGIHGPLHLTLSKLVRYVHVIPHARQCLVNLLFAGYQFCIMFLINFKVLRLIGFVLIIRISRLICSFLST